MYAICYAYSQDSRNLLIKKYVEMQSIQLVKFMHSYKIPKQCPWFFGSESSLIST